MRIGLVAALAYAMFQASFLQTGMSQTVSVLTQHNDLTRDGANPNETILTTSNVNESSFGKAFSLPVDGFVFAQPLYASGVAIPGQGTHNVVYVATAHDSVYAFDADSGTLYWQVSLGTAVPSSVIGTTNIQVEVGIISTPVIDLGSGTLYVTAKTYENKTQIYRLHALDITTGAEKFDGPVEIAASASGSAPEGNGGIVTFVAGQQLQRPAVTLVNGVVYLAFGSHDDRSPYHGWVLGYDAKTLQQVQVFNDTPNSGQGSIWMGGQGLVADASNNLYMITANSSLSSGPGTGDLATGDYGESFLKLVPSGNSLSVADYFKPYYFDWLNANDMDLGSGGAFAIPGTSYIAGGGKEGIIYVVDTNSMGKLNISSDQVVQEFEATSAGLFGAPAFFNNTMYVWGINRPLMAYNFTAGLFNTTPSSQSNYASPLGETSGAVSISSNGTTSGTAIVWATTPTGDPDGATVGGDLYAFDGADVTTQLWSTALNESRDGFGNYAKWVAPTVANGKVYVATDSEQVAVYGLLSASITLGNLAQTYSGSPLAVTTTTSPAGLPVIVTYTGTGGTAYGPSTTAPTSAGTYEVAANVGANAGDYTATATGTFLIARAPATVTWNAPASITYGTALSALQLNATSSLAGKFAYTPPLGTVLPVGPQTLSVSFTPTDAADYATTTSTVSLTVGKATLTVTADNASRTYGVANPAFTDTISGFVNGDTQSVVTGTALFSTTATTSSAIGPYPITAALGTLSAANYGFSFVSGTLTVGQATPVISWSTPAAITYGTALSATQLDASSTVAGTFAYTPALGAVLPGGSQTLSVTFTPTDTADYAGATSSVTLTVNQQPQTISLSSSTQSYKSGVTFGTPALVLSATSTSGLPVTFGVVSGPATLSGSSLTITGGGTVVIAANQAGNGDYLAALAVTESIVVGKAQAATTISSSLNPILAQNSITFTATSTSSAGAPSGTVAFMDGSTPLGTGTLAGGVATFATSSLSAGSHTITAAYSGDANFLSSTSTPLTQVIEDFGLNVSASAVTVSPGGTAVFTFTATPMDGTTFPSAVQLTAKGLPAGATSSFSPATIAAGAGATTVTLTIDIPQTQAGLRQLAPHGATDLAGNRSGNPRSMSANRADHLAPFLLALVLLPFANRWRRTGKRWGHMLCVLFLLSAGLAAVAGIGGCGGSSASTPSIQEPQSYTMTVTGTSGALSHSTTITLTVN